MGNDVVAIVKIRNYETGERNRERLCYLQSSPKYLNYDNKWFFDHIKTLWTLEKYLTGKDVNYEIELINEQDIAVERFNKRLKGEDPINFYIYDHCVAMDFIEYLKGKTDDKHMINLLSEFYEKLKLFNDGVDEYYRLHRYVEYISKQKVEASNKKGGSKVR